MRYEISGEYRVLTWKWETECSNPGEHQVFTWNRRTEMVDLGARSEEA
jgi:hypothetical protein